MDFNMEPTVTEKQAYLRREILESGYDPDDFISFVCGRLSLGSLEIEEWQMEKIVDMVGKFKEDKRERKSLAPEVMIFDSSRPKVYYQDANVFDYQFSVKRECLKAAPLLKTNELKVRITAFQITTAPGFLNISTKSLLWFIIESSALKGKVKRLADDLEWFSNAVPKVFPNIAVPELVGITKGKEDNFEKRREEAQEYLQLLAERKELRQSHIFLDFLTLNDSKMEKLKEVVDSIQKRKGVSSLKSDTGQISIQLLDHHRLFWANCEDYLRKVENIHGNIHESITRVSDLLKESHNELNKVVTYFAMLHEEYTKLNTLDENQPYPSMLVSLNVLFHTISQDIRHKFTAMDTHLKDYHKLVLNYDRSLYKLHRNVRETQKDYVNTKVQLERKKQKILQERKGMVDILPKETAIQQENKEWLAYFYEQFRTEFSTYAMVLTRRYSNKIASYCTEIVEKQAETIGKMNEFLGDCRKVLNS